MRQIVRQLHAACAVPSELSLAAQQDRRLFLNERKGDVVRHRLGEFLAMHLRQFGLGVEEINVAWRSFGEEEDASLCFRSEVWRPRRKRITRPTHICCQETVLLQKRS